MQSVVVVLKCESEEDLNSNLVTSPHHLLQSLFEQCILVQTLSGR